MNNPIKPLLRAAKALAIIQGNDRFKAHSVASLSTDDAAMKFSFQMLALHMSHCSNCSIPLLLRMAEPLTQVSCLRHYCAGSAYCFDTSQTKLKVSRSQPPYVMCGVIS